MSDDKADMRGVTGVSFKKVLNVKMNEYVFGSYRAVFILFLEYLPDKKRKHFSLIG